MGKHKIKREKERRKHFISFKPEIKETYSKDATLKVWLCEEKDVVRV